MAEKNQINLLGQKFAGQGSMWRDAFIYRPGHQTLVVNANAALALDLHPQDTISIEDREGGQPITLIVSGDNIQKTLSLPDGMTTAPFTGDLAAKLTAVLSQEQFKIAQG